MGERSVSAPPVRRLRAVLGDPYARGTSLLTIAVYLLTLAWSFSMPHFDGPDEIRHYNSVARLVDGGGWPPPYEAELLPSVRTAMYEADLFRVSANGAAWLELPLPADRSRLFGPTDIPAGSMDQMVQHPPAYYALLAAAYSVVEGDGMRWDIALLTMRAMSAAIFAAAVPFVVGGVRRATGSRTAALVGTSALVGIPFFMNAGAVVTNDSLLTLTISAAVYFLLRFADDPGASRLWQVAAGLAVGAALLTKGFALMFLPVVVLLGLLAVHRRGEWRSARGAVTAGLPLALGAAIGGWWWVRNLVVHGVVQPSTHGSRERTGIASEGYEGPIAFAVSAWERLAATFWGRGVNPDIAFANGLTSFASATAMAVLVAAVVMMRHRAVLVVLAVYPALVIGTTLMNAHGIYFDTGDPDRGVQGRYLYSGIVALAIAIGVVSLALARRLGPRATAMTAPALAIPWMVGLAGLYVMRQRTWDTRSVSLETAGVSVGEWMGVSPLVATALALVAATTVLALVRATQRVSRSDDPTLAATEGPAGRGRVREFGL